VSGVAIVIPAFNEQASIGDVATELGTVGRVIVVDDASSDATATEASAAGAHVVRRETNGGYDAAIDAGFREATALGYRHVLTADGDGQHAVDDVAAFAELLESAEADLVVGIRPGRQRSLERICAWYARRALGIRDPLCGLKGYDVRFFEEYGSFDRRGSVGTELMTYAARHGARCVQRPIALYAREDGGSRFYSTLRGNLRILRSLWAMIRVR
jgi:glycosyltransferase involved in cell wall biosynthesis